MKAKDFRRLGNEKLKERMGKAMVVAGVYSLITTLMNSLPLVGGVAALVLAPVLTYGLYKAIVEIINGKNVGAFEFFSYGFNEFGKVWGLVWEIIKKVWVPFILLIISIIVMVIGSVGVFSGDSTVFTTVSIFSLVLMLVSSIWLTIKSLQYTLIYFELVHNPEGTAKEMSVSIGAKMKGNIGKIFNIMFHYAIALALIAFGLGFCAGIIEVVLIGIVGEGLFATVLKFVIETVAVVFANAIVLPRLVSSYNELYLYRTQEISGSQPVYAAQENLYGEPVQPGMSQNNNINW